MRIGKGTSRAARWMLAAVMAFGASVAMAQITGTKHNLGTTAGGGPNKVTGTALAGTGTAEICVFCHTPHAGDNSVAGLPLWNKKLPTSGAGYTLYSSSTMNATRATDGVAGGAAIGSVSLACLSCHDGTQAMDNILNAPGSGGYDVNGGGSNGLGYTWAGSVDVNGKMTNSLTTLSMLGQDLSNDHPIGIQYCGGGPKVADAGAACNDTDFKTPDSATIGGNLAFWVETGVAASGRQKTDMILYNRLFAAGEGPSVECASCHDPHTANTTFLRIENTGSAVCLACHSK